jgi:hypothetical protein
MLKSKHQRPTEKCVRSRTSFILLSVALLSCLLMMVESQKRAAVDNSNPLHLPGVLELVLRFVGSGQGLFMSTHSCTLPPPSTGAAASKQL